MGKDTASPFAITWSQFFQHRTHPAIRGRVRSVRVADDAGRTSVQVLDRHGRIVAQRATPPEAARRLASSLATELSLPLGGTGVTP